MKNTDLEVITTAVATRVSELQRQYLADVSTAVRDLAFLRRHVTAQPGSSPEIWDHTLGLIPEKYQGRSDQPNRIEVATHSSMTLYATHQQGRTEPMHVSGRGLGAAIRLLGQTQHNEEAVLRRFHVLVAASSGAATYHLRGLVHQLRGATISMDYVQLWRDLYDLQNPDRGDAVRLRWGRDYHRVTQTQPDNQTHAAADAEPNPAPSTASVAV